MLWVLAGAWATVPVEQIGGWDADPAGWAPEDELLDVGDSPAQVRVVGGELVPIGEWNDTVGVVFQAAYVGCTGTLVAPTVVVTAAHCAGGITHVLINTKNWLLESPGEEFIVVQRTHVHPSYDGYFGADIAVLELAEPARTTPRPIATECVLEESLGDGALVTIAGFGAIDYAGNASTSQLRAADTLVVDHDCSEDVLGGIATGCDPELRPGGELGAGGHLDVDGDGSKEPARDACFGDSGGPLYLRADRGDYLVGVTSRAFWGVSNQFPCRDGGIWVRPDAYIDWMEEVTGVQIARAQCNLAPEVEVKPVRVPPGKSRKAKIRFEDPEGTGYAVEVLSEPTLGEVVVEGEVVWFTAHAGVKGEELVRLGIRDLGSPDWPDSHPQVVEVDWEVKVGRSLVPSCGCAAGSPGAGWLALGLGALALARRRRGPARAA